MKRTDMGDRIVHWELVLKSTSIPSKLHSDVATILAQDELRGSTWRTIKQQRTMEVAASYGSLPQ